MPVNSAVGREPRATAAVAVSGARWGELLCLALGEHEMGTVTFGQLPMIVRVAVGIAFLEVWVSIEQLVIEPTGFWRYLPFYRVGGYCVYDFTVTFLVIAGL